MAQRLHAQPPFGEAFEVVCTDTDVDFRALIHVEAKDTERVLANRAALIGIRSYTRKGDAIEYTRRGKS